VLVEGHMVNIADLARRLNVNYHALYSRLRYHQWDASKVSSMNFRAPRQNRRSVKPIAPGHSSPP
jgi:hypothetical protein